jgi:hypothetical protein
VAREETSFRRSAHNVGVQANLCSKLLQADGTMASRIIGINASILPVSGPHRMNMVLRELVVTLLGKFGYKRGSFFEKKYTPITTKDHSQPLNYITGISFIVYKEASVRSGSISDFKNNRHELLLTLYF